MTPHDADNTRRAELAKIHLAAKQLGLEKDDYRAVAIRISAKFRATPTDSAGEMTAVERRALLDEFARLGFRAAPPRDKADDWIESKMPHVRKMAACAFELERIGAVRSGSTRRWLRKFVKKLTGRDAIQWLTPQDCNKIIEALKAWRKKFEAKRQPAAEKKTPANGANAANVTAKTAAFEAMRIIFAVPEPVDFIRRSLSTLASRKFATPENEAAGSELIRDFGLRASAALGRWDYAQAQDEMIRLLALATRFQPDICDQMEAAWMPAEKEPEGVLRRSYKGRGKKE
jgi:phage gp16-like protein